MGASLGSSSDTLSNLYTTADSLGPASQAGLPMRLSANIQVGCVGDVLVELCPWTPSTLPIPSIAMGQDTCDQSNSVGAPEALGAPALAPQACSHQGVYPEAFFLRLLPEPSPTPLPQRASDLAQSSLRTSCHITGCLPEANVCAHPLPASSSSLFFDHFIQGHSPWNVNPFAFIYRQHRVRHCSLIALSKILPVPLNALHPPVSTHLCSSVANITYDIVF
ncbi:hypothetical protein C8F01DRAFT_1081695 [Mycena amicta]|nr:hypothetical protein C8F01DRAFT_1081695 [Mycena amicta]